MEEEKKRESDARAGEDMPMIDDSMLLPAQSEKEKDEIWVAAGFKLPRPKEED